jgi:hypothetical protein
MRAGDHWRDKTRGEAADALEQIGYLLVLEPELEEVVQVLVLAAAAQAEVRTEWFNSIGGSGHHTKQPGTGEAPLYLGDFRFHDLARGDEGNEDDKILRPGNAFATEGDVVNRQGQLVAQNEAHAQ